MGGEIVAIVLLLAIAVTVSFMFVDDDAYDLSQEFSDETLEDETSLP